MLLLLFFTKLIALCLLHREEKLLRRVAMVAKFLDLNIPGPANMAKKIAKKLTVKFSPELRNKTVAHIFPSYANGRLCQEILLRFRNFCYHGNVTSCFISQLPRPHASFSSLLLCYRHNYTHSIDYSLDTPFKLPLV